MGCKSPEKHHCLCWKFRDFLPSSQPNNSPCQSSKFILFSIFFPRKKFLCRFTHRCFLMTFPYIHKMNEYKKVFLGRVCSPDLFFTNTSSKTLFFQKTHCPKHYNIFFHHIFFSLFISCFLQIRARTTHNCCCNKLPSLGRHT